MAVGRKTARPAPVCAAPRRRGCSGRTSDTTFVTPDARRCPSSARSWPRESDAVTSSRAEDAVQTTASSMREHLRDRFDTVREIDGSPDECRRASISSDVLVRLSRPVPFRRTNGSAVCSHSARGTTPPRSPSRCATSLCSMVNIVPTRQFRAEMMKAVVRANQNTAGIYGTSLARPAGGSARRYFSTNADVHAHTSVRGTHADNAARPGCRTSFDMASFWVM